MHLSRPRPSRACARIMLLACLSCAMLVWAAPQAGAAGLSRSAVIKLIKQYSKPGKTGKTGKTGPTGSLGPIGLSGAAGAAAATPAYSAGAGLLLSNSVFSFDPSVLQARVGACPASQAIVSIAASGAPTCDFGAVVFSKDYAPNNAIGLTGAPTTIASTPVGNDNYFVTADVTLTNSANLAATATCEIFNSGSPSAINAETSATIPPSGGTASLSLQSWQGHPGGGNDVVACLGAGVSTWLAQGTTTANITAIPVSSASTFG
jgi:hypothetical protein